MSEDNNKDYKDLYAGQRFDEAIVAAMSGIADSQLSLSELADSKANIMITVCSILLSLAVAKIEQGELIIPIAAFSVFCIPALIFSILTVMPSAGTNEKPVDHPSKLKVFNPLFFMHSSLVPMREFEYEFEKIMTDPQKYYGYMARDIYIAGLVLRTKKYRYLRWSYQSLLMGVGLGVAALVIDLLI
jgi:Na+-transporting methylmalonyl-CoA/oxaloacetate decarboxylase beta subunit